MTAQIPALRQAELIRAIAQAAGSVPENEWQRLHVIAHMTVSSMRMPMRAFTPEGSEARMYATAEARAAARELRELMYQPGKGTWFTMELFIDSPGSVRTAFHYDRMPRFHPLLTPAAYAADVGRFPRDEAHLPAWLREQLEQAKNPS